MELLRRSLTLLVILFVLPLWAEDEYIIETDSAATSQVTIYDEGLEGQKKSEWGAAMLNLALPGAGHLYLKENKRAAVYLSIEAVTFMGMLFSEMTHRRYYDDARNIAFRYAHTETGRSDDDDYWRNIGLVESSETYNELMRLNRTFDKQYLHHADQWDWDSEEDREQYGEVRSNGDKWHDAWSIFMGGLALNRLVSFVDARVMAKRYNRSILSRVHVQPVYSLVTDEGGLYLTFDF